MIIFLSSDSSWKTSKFLHHLLVLFVSWFAFSALAHAQPPDSGVYVPNAIERVSMERAYELVGGPTLISLDFDNAPPQRVYEELFRQARIAPRLSGPNLWQQHTTPLTFHCARRPFRTVVRDLEEQSGLTVFSIIGIHEYVLATREEAIKSARYLQGPSVMSDGFEVIVAMIEWSEYRALFPPRHPIGDDLEEGLSINDNAGRKLVLYVLPDPKFGWPRAFGIRPEAAVDEKGNSLLLPEGTPQNQDFGTFLASASLYLVRPGGLNRTDSGPGASRKIARLRGSMRLFFVSASETWEIPNPLNTLPQSKELVFPEGKESYTVGKLETDGGSWSTIYTVARPEPPADLPPLQPVAVPRPLTRSDVVFNFMCGSLSLEYPGGASQPSSGYGGGNAVQYWRYLVSFPIPEAGKEQTPSRLVWKIPTEWKEVEVPFEFKDLPLP